MSDTLNQLNALETKPFGRKTSLESSTKKEELYLRIDNFYLNNKLNSIKNKNLEIPSITSIQERLSNICPEVKNKFFTLHLTNIGSIVNYKLIDISNVNNFDINEKKFFYKLTDITQNKEETKETTKKDKDKDEGISQILFDDFNQKIEDEYNTGMVNYLNENIKYNGDEEKTKEETHGNELIIDETKILNISFIKSIKFSSSKDYNDTLIFDIEKLKDSGNLQIIFELLSNNEYCKGSLSPIFFENYWYVPLPEWAYSIKSFDPFNLILAIILLIIILVISQNSNINDMSYVSQIDDIYGQNKKKINELKEDPMIIDTLFSQKMLKSMSNEISEIYFESSTLKKEYNKNDVITYFYNQLINLKKYVMKFDTNQEKLEKLFEKVTFYSFSDVLNSYHYTYLYFRKFLLKYSAFQNITEIMNEFYTKISNNNDILKPYKDKSANEIKQYIMLKLSPKYIINFIDYGSSAMDLEINSSDRDILIYFEERDKFNSISQEQFCAELYSELNKLYYLNINKRFPKYIGQLLEIEYNINYKFNKESNNNVNLKKIHIDITFTKDKNYVEYIKEMIKIVKTDLLKNPCLKPLNLILKTIIKNKGYNKTFNGGINSLSIYFLSRHIVIIYEKDNPSLGRLLYLFLKKYSEYDFTYGIDENGNEFPYDQKSIQDSKKRFIIINPVIIKDKNYFTNTNDNIAYGCFKPKNIIHLFNDLFKRYFYK